MILNTIYMIVATLGFCIIFNIKGRNLYFAALGGGLGWFVYLICLNIKLSTSTAMFIASIAIGAYSEIMARINKTPVTTFVVCALIPLVPGSGMYYTMVASIKGDVNTSLKTGLEALTNAGALAMGIVLVSSVSRLINTIISRKRNRTR